MPTQNITSTATFFASRKNRLENPKCSVEIVAKCLIAALNNEKYPTVNRNAKKALAWITDMARDNQVFILPKKVAA